MSNTRLPNRLQSTQTQPHLSRRKLYAAMLIASQWMAAGQLWAAPEGGEVVGGEGVITQTGVDTMIHQATERMAIDWRSFDVAANERVEFIQPSSSSIALNRVLSNNGSQILGRIDSNGQVMLVNPNGVVFGKDSIINVGGMIASGMNIDPASFINGDFTLNSLEGTDGKVINYGIINAATGGSVTLVGQQVQNDGLISAKLGAVNLAAGNEAVLTFDQSGLVGVKVTEAVLQNELGVDAAVINSGEINAEGGRVLLSASVSEDIFSNAVNNAGMNKSSSVVVHDDGSFTLGAGADVINTGDINTSVATGAAGQVVVVGNNITSSGTITANTGSGTAGAIELHSTDTTLVTESGNVSAQAATQGEGGDIKILGNKVGLFDSAEVNASGADGGGQVLIGGDKTGHNEQVRNADFIYLGENTNVKTDALIDGDGGKLITFASDTARIYGNLYSRGGSEGGNGGFIETSGLKGFEILNTPDITAVVGTGGTWLIDPYDLNIGGSSGDFLTNSGTIEAPVFTPTNSTARVTITTLQNALKNNASVLINTRTAGNGTGGNISLESDLIYNNNTSGANRNDTSRNTLVLTAAKDIYIKNDITRAEGSTGNLSLELLAVGNVYIFDDKKIETHGGSFKATGVNFDSFSRDSATDELNGNTKFGTIDTSSDVGGGNITIDVSGYADIGSLIFRDSNLGAQTQVASVSINAGGDVSLNREIDFANVGSISNNTASFKIESDGNIAVNQSILDSGNGLGTLDVTLIANKNNDDAKGNITIAENKTIETRGGYFYAGVNKDTNENPDTEDGLSDTDINNPQLNTFTSNRATIDTTGDLGGGDIVVNATGNITLGALRFGLNHVKADAGSLERVGSVTVFSRANVEFNGLIDFNDSGKRTGAGANGYAEDLLDHEDTDIRVFAYGNIDINAEIRDGKADDSNEATRSWGGDGRDALNIFLTADSNNNGAGNINVNANVYTAGGNFTATGINFDSVDFLINTDRANASDNNNTAAWGNGNATWSNGGDVTISAKSTVSLGSIVTDAEATSGTRRGNLLIQGVNRDANGISTNNVTVKQNGVWKVAGTATFNTGTDGDIELMNNNIFNGNLLFASAGDVQLTAVTDPTQSADTTAVTFGASRINGTLELTSGGNVTQEGAVYVGKETELTFTAANRSINLATHANDFDDQVTLTNSVSNLSLHDINDLTLGAVTLVAGAAAPAGNIELTSGDGHFIILKGNLNSTNGATKNITLNSNVTLASDVELDAGTGNILFGGTVNSNDAAAKDLTLTGRNITLAGALGDRENRSLDAVEIDSSGLVTIGAPTIKATSLTVEGAGTVEDSLTLTNGTNNWLVDDINSGEVKKFDENAVQISPTISFSGISKITGGSGVDTFNLDANITTSINGGADNDIFDIDFASLDALINGGLGNDVFNINLATTKAFLNGDAGADIFNVNNAGNVTAVLAGGDDADPDVKDTLNAAIRDNDWLLGDTEKLNENLTFSGIENVNGNSGKDKFSIVGDRAVTGTIDADGVGATDNSNDEVTVANDATINFSSGNFSFFNVLNAEVLSSTNGGKLTVLSNANDMINWVFATDKSVVKGSSSVKFSNFSSYEGGDGDDIFLVEGSVQFTGLVDGAGGDNIFDFDTATGGYSIVLGSVYQTGSSATLSRIGEIKANSDAGTSLEAIAGTNFWEITAKDSGKVGSTTFTGVSTIIGASPSDSISTSIDGDANWFIKATDPSTLSDTNDPQNLLISFSNIGKLVGSNYRDTFAFEAGASIVSAEGNGGTDTADFSNLAARTITIGTATEFAFSGVERFKADASKAFVLSESSGATWTIDNTNGEIDGTVDNIEFVGFRTLQGSNVNDTFNLKTNFDGIINAGDGSDTFEIRSDYTGELQGGNGADAFEFFDGGSIGGIANAGSDDSARDRVDLSRLAGGTVNVSGTTVYGVTNIERVTADSGKAFTLAANNAPNDWTIEVANGIDGTLNQLEFAGFNTLQGGAGKDTFAVKTNFTGVVNGNGGADDFEIDAAFSGTLDGGADADTFAINANVTGNILGGSGSDRFIFASTANVEQSNTADGGNGAGTDVDEVDLSGVNDNRTIVLDGSAIYGLTGIERVIGNANTNFTLDARATTTTLDWIIDDVRGRVAGIEFVNFSTLLGGSGVDRFTFNTDFTGIVDGLGGDDTFTLNSIFTGTARGSDGKDTFAINSTIRGSLNGGDEEDRFVFSSSGLIDSNNGEVVSAGGGMDIVDLSSINANTSVVLTDDTLYGVSGVERILGNGGDTYTFTLSTTLSGTDWAIYDFDGGSDLSDGVNDGRVADIDFVDFNELQGGDGVDKFDLQADFAGIIDAGGGDDEFNIRKAITGTLLGGDGSDAYVFFHGGSVASSGNSNAGVGNRDSANFNNLADGSPVTVSGASVMNIGGIEQVVGSATKQFTLQAGGAGANIWRITDENDGVVNDIQFIDFKNLVGGSGSDTFTFEGTTSFVESINGGSGIGINTLRGRDERNTWRVLTTNAGTVSLNGAPSPYVVFSQIQDLTGGALADEFQINASIRNVMGGDGNDRFTFSIDNNIGTANFIDGEGGEDQVVGRRTDNTWSTTGANAGTLGVAGNLYVTNFSGVERWVGGVGADVFTLNHEISNGISAGDGDNLFNVNTEVGDLDGGAGNDQFVFGDAGSARSVNGGDGTENSLTARNTSNTWTITSTNSGKIASGSNDYVDSFSGIQILNGGTDIDIFNINASVGNVFGHAGDDTFSFAANNNGIAALIDGGADSDTLRGRVQNSTWTMTAANAGYVATANTTYVAAFNAIETLSGAANGDTLAAINQVNNWAIDGENRGSLRAAATGATAVAFDGMENLLGNQGVDTFTFAASGNITGLIDGGTTTSKDINSDIVNLSLKTGGVTVQLGRELSDALNVVNVEGIVAAKDVNNNLIGASDADYQWRITADDQGVVETLVNPLLETSTRFTYFNNVTGGSQDDYFKVVSGRITNRIDGGGGDGTDFIDYSERAGHFDIELGSSDGISTAGVYGIEGIRGNSASGLGTSTIKVNGDDSDWEIGSVIGSAADGINDGSVTTGGNKVTFENFTNLYGGSGNDKFIYLDNGQWIGVIDGGSGTNTVNASQSTKTQQFHINSDGVGVTHLLRIGGVTGNGANSTLASTSSANIWSVDNEGIGQLNDSLEFRGIANLTGGTSTDEFNLQNISSLTGIIDGGSGSSTDKLNLTGINSNLSISIGSNPDANLQVTDIESISANPNRSNTMIADSLDNTWVISDTNTGTLNSSLSFSGFANLVGREKVDTFTFTNALSNITGWIDAGDGVDALDLTTSNRDLVVRITAGNTFGNNGEITVSNFETITADADKNNKLIAKNTNNTWTITSTDGGKLSAADSAAATDFANFKHLTGGNQDDTFHITSIGAITGLVDGGGHQEGDVVDVSESVNANIVITAAGATSGYSNIEKYVGNNTTSTIAGDNRVNDWIINNNSGTINSTIEFEKFANIVGGNNRDNFTLNNATLSGYIDGADGNDTFTLAGSAVAGELRGGAGDDSFDLVVVSGYTGNTNLLGGLGSNRIVATGGGADYKATHQQGVIQYSNAANATYSANYSEIADIQDNVVADSLTVWGTSANDIFRLQNNKYQLNPAISINYSQKQNLIINGSSADQVILDGNVSIPKRMTVNNASIATENAGNLIGQSLELVATQDVGSASNRVQLAVDEIYLKSTNGNIYINEQDSLNLKEFSTSATGIFDLTLGGDLLSATSITYAGQFNVDSLRGGIALNNANSFTGNLNLKAAGDVALKNLTSVNFAEVTAQNLTVETDGAVNSVGPMIVNGLTSISANSNVSLLNADNDFNSLKILKVGNVSLRDKNNLTLAGVLATGSVTMNANGAINISASCSDNCLDNFGVRATNLDLNAGIGSIIVGKNIAASDGVTLQANGITINDAITAKRMTFNAGSGVLLLNESGSLNGQAGVLIDLSGAKVDQRSNIIGGAKINITAIDDIQMATNAVTESLSGDVSYNGKNIGLATIKAVNGSVSLSAGGSITDNNDSNTNIYANRWVADAISGIGLGRLGVDGQDAIETDVNILSVRNAGKILGYTDATINILNADSLTIEQLRNNGDISIANLTGDFVLDNTNNERFNINEPDARLQGGVINANTGLNGGTLTLSIPNGKVSTNNLADRANPDIIANVGTFDYPLGTRSNFGDRKNKIVLHIPDVYNQTARTSSVVWHIRKPNTIVDTSKALNELDNMVNDQLIQIEGLNEIDPAIFTGVRNYIHDEVAILMPADQRFDDDEYAE